jgi:hypothetical protein
MSLVDTVGRSFVNSSSHQFILPFSADFAYTQSSLGSVNSNVEQQ